MSEMPFRLNITRIPGRTSWKKSRSAVTITASIPSSQARTASVAMASSASCPSISTIGTASVSSTSRIRPSCSRNSSGVSARPAEWLDVSPASVSEAVKRLGQRDLVKTGDDRRIRLTGGGERLARALVRRHRLAERFLVEVVGLPWHLAHEEATEWGRVISDRVEERLVDILGDPPTCVHGNPIPGTAHPVDQSDLRPLDRVEAGGRGRAK